MVLCMWGIQDDWYNKEWNKKPFKQRSEGNIKRESK